MNPAKISIEGDFWDCQIYRGRLYLWEVDNKLLIIDWNELVESFIERAEQELALTCAFLDGRYLYAENLKVLFEDREFKNLLTHKFYELTQRKLVVTRHELNKFVIGVQDNPFDELQTDSEIVSNKIYAVTYDGFFSAGAHKPTSNKYLVSSKTTKINDFQAFSLKAGKYAKLALSGGSEGLYEYNAASNSSYYYETAPQEKDKIRCITDKHSSFADFNFLSLYNSSLVGESFLSLHKWGENSIAKKFSRATGKPVPDRIVEKEISQSEIFGNNQSGLSWGTNEKIYWAKDNRLKVVRFNNYAKEDESYFSNVRTHEFQAWKGKILKGGTAYFGTIVECENAVVVLTGRNDFVNLPGSATRWRIYPRSLNYENHLHVIQDDRIEIFSFNHDYFRNQDEKEFGIQFDDRVRINSSYFRAI